MRSTKYLHRNVSRGQLCYDCMMSEKGWFILEREPWGRTVQSTSGWHSCGSHHLRWEQKISHVGYTCRISHLSKASVQHKNHAFNRARLPPGLFLVLFILGTFPSFCVKWDVLDVVSIRWSNTKLAAACDRHSRSRIPTEYSTPVLCKGAFTYVAALK